MKPKTVARRGELRADFLTGSNFSAIASTLLPSLSRVVPEQYWKYVGPNYVGGAYVNASLIKAPDSYEIFAETYSYSDANRMRRGHFTSSNGSDWIRRPTGLNHATNFPAVRALAWGAGRFVAVSEGSSPGSTTNLTSPHRIYTSTDGEAYSPVNPAGVAPALNGEGLTGVAYGSGQFVAVGNAGF